MNRFGQRITDPDEDFRAGERLEILDLVWRFAAAMDIGDLDMFEACFAARIRWDLSRNPVRWTGGPADDGEVELDRAEFMAIVRGRDAAKRAVPPGGRPFVRRLHQHGILNPIVTFTGETSGTVLAFNHERIHGWLDDTPGGEACEWMDQGGWYHIDTQRFDRRWRISALRLEINFFDPPSLYRDLRPRHAGA